MGAIKSDAPLVDDLAIVLGLELESYLIEERPNVPGHRARNLVNLGLGGMLHDIGKVQVDSEAAAHHETFEPDWPRPRQYENHLKFGYDMLHHAGAPPTVRHVVMAHHQRFDGRGWSDTAQMGAEGHHRQAGRKLHVFARIVSAANVLDGLMRDADGSQRPPVAVLAEFASHRFDGWFDPKVRTAALRRLPPFAVGSHVGLNDGSAAVVLAPNVQQPCRPAVRLLESPADGGEPPILFLEDHPRLSIASYTGIDVSHWLFQLADPESESPPGESNRPLAA